MRIAFVADVHLGNHKRFGGEVTSSLNLRCRQALDVLQAAYDRAVELECDSFVVAGDLFDRSNPPPQLVAEVMRILEPMTKPACAREMWIDLLLGNHELVSSDPDDHALASLQFTQGLRIHTTPTWLTFGVPKSRTPVKVLCVPFMPGEASKWLPKVLEDACRHDGGKRKPERSILVTHLGVSDDDTAVYLRGAHDSVEALQLADLCKEHGFGFVVTGNWHDRKRWQMAWPDPKQDKLNHTLQILQLGALVPTGFNNPGLEGYGTLAIYDGGKLKVEELRGPRFLKTDPEKTYTFEPGSIVYTEAIVDDTEARVAARTAATSARSATTLDEALGGYVERMPLEEGIDRKAVLAKAKEYLAK